MTIHAAYYGGHEYESIRDAVAAHDADQYDDEPQPTEAGESDECPTCAAEQRYAPPF